MAYLVELPADARCFRPRRYYLLLGVGCAVFFAVLGAFSASVAFFNIDGSFPQPRLSALILGGGWLLMTLPALWVIAAYFRERLFLSADQILQHGIFRSKQLNAGEVLQLRWRTRPLGGSVVARTGARRVTVNFHDFTTHERDEIIRFFRVRFAERDQENWIRFEQDIWRASPTTIRFSPSGFIAIAVVWTMFAAVFVYVWLAGFGAGYLVIGVVNALAAIWSLWRIRSSQQRPAKSP